jgi:hypothetical protein
MKKLILSVMLPAMFSSGSAYARVFPHFEYLLLRNSIEFQPWYRKQWQDMRPSQGIDDGLSELAGSAASPVAAGTVRPVLRCGSSTS